MRLEPIVEGNPSGETILFVQGWPDDASLWDGAVAALRARYRCVRVNMPNYGGRIDARWGPTTDEIVDALVALIRELAAERPITLVLHDWGCYWGHAAHHRCPEAVARVAGVDVAPHYRPSPRAALGIVAYQGWLLAAYAVGGSIGNWMTRSFAKRAGAPADGARIDARMNYPYRNVFADLFRGRVAKRMRRYWPTCPLLFVYGTKKPSHFHSPAWIDHVKRVGGEVVGLATGHWVPCDPAFVTLLSTWLERTATERTALAS